jgi:hypothetical protein
MPYLIPHEIEKRVRIRTVDVRPYARSFAFTITWQDQAGARYPDNTQVELAYAPPGEDFVARANSAHIFEIRLELERSGPTRAKQLGISLDAYYSALDGWDGRVTILTGKDFTTPQQIPNRHFPSGPYQAQVHQSGPAQTASDKPDDL